MSAHIINLARHIGSGRRPPPPRIEINDALARIDRSTAWLAANKVTVIATLSSTLSAPIVVVDATPAVWILFSGRAERVALSQDGAIRTETWEGYDRVNHVRVRWLEMSACAT